jgi:hypothetical protein
LSQAVTSGNQRVARRRRQTVAEHVRDDDEVFFRIERHPRSDQPFVVVVLAGIPGRVDDGVVLRRVQIAEGFVGKLAAAQRRAALQAHIAEIVGFIQRDIPIGFPDLGCRRGNQRFYWCFCV